MLSQEELSLFCEGKVVVKIVYFILFHLTKFITVKTMYILGNYCLSSLKKVVNVLVLILCFLWSKFSDCIEKVLMPAAHLLQDSLVQQSTYTRQCI